MRTACLVLAFQAAPVLRYALGIYTRLGWDVFIHLDPKADKLAYQQVLGERAWSCQFIEDPVPVFWGGFSMVEAEFKLIDAALSKGVYDRFLLLSDDSFPVRSLGELQEIVAEDIDRITLVKQPPESGFYKRYYGFFCFDHRATSPRGGHGREIDQTLVAKIDEVGSLLQLGKKVIDVYFGSQFWMLRRETVVRIIDICRADTHLWKSFEFAAIPDELMIQSVYGNHLRDSPYANGPVFADFSNGSGPRTYSSLDQLPRELPGHVAFIRKIEPHAGPLLHELENWVPADGWGRLSCAVQACTVALMKIVKTPPGRTDLALNKPATQSSVSAWSHGRTVEEDARGANCDVIPDDYGFCTANEASPWWQTDLQDVFAISEIQITNRRTSPERLRRFSLLGSLDGETWELLYQKCDDSVFGQNGDESLILRFSRHQHAARYVRLRLEGTGFLHFRSVRVFGDLAMR